MLKHFPGQKPNEVIKHVVRKHWIIHVKIMMFFLVLTVVPTVIYFGLQFRFDFLELTANAKRWITLIYFLYMDLALLLTLIRWIEEELDIVIVTNERIISIDQVSFLHRTISETELSQVQDVKHVAKGIMANVLGFGSLEVQTAAQKIMFMIKNVEKPYEMARSIIDLCNTYKKDFLKDNHGSAQNSGIDPM
jgi:hypothetical protein